MDLMSNYQKYKWFFTLSGKLVLGGKSAEQNDFLLKEIKKEDKTFMVMHTASPGSPFSVILSDIKNVNKEDIEECAIFTACFSQAWKSAAKKVKVHYFTSSQVHKDKKMKQGTWSVVGKVKEIEVPLLLSLTRQKNILRAVPLGSIKNKKDILLEICPGKISKDNFVAKLATELSDNFSQIELLSAFPAGGLQIRRK